MKFSFGVVKVALSSRNFVPKMGLSARAYASKLNVIGTCREPEFGTIS